MPDGPTLRRLDRAGSVVCVAVVRRIAFLFALGATFLAPGEVRADVSSWMAVGGGYTAQLLAAPTGGWSGNWVPAVGYSIGVGSSSSAREVVGGLIRGETFIGLGTDLGAAARFASGSFARGDWGVALDIGAAWRSWQNSVYGEWPIQAVLTAGSPWGLQLALGVEVSNVPGASPSDGIFLTIEVDFLRLTVMRQGSSERWWYNPAPAGGHVTRE
jgi:hypothetical protein